MFFCIVFELRNQDNGESDDESVEGIDDGYDNRGNYLDNMTEMEERVDARIHKLDETHEQQLQAIRSHNQEIDTLRKENKSLRKEIAGQVNEQKEMKR